MLIPYFYNIILSFLLNTNLLYKIQYSIKNTCIFSIEYIPNCFNFSNSNTNFNKHYYIDYFDKYLTISV